MSKQAPLASRNFACKKMAFSGPGFRVVEYSVFPKIGVEIRLGVSLSTLHEYY